MQTTKTQDGDADNKDTCGRCRKKLNRRVMQSTRTLECDAVNNDTGG